jgi:hypothetical protein
MANPGVWSPGTSEIPIGPIKINTMKIPSGKSMDVPWTPLEVTSTNYAVKNIQYQIENGIVKFRYPTTSDPDGPKTEASSIQGIAGDSLYVARLDYSNDTTTAIRSALQKKLNAQAQSIEWDPSPTQPEPTPGAGAGGGTEGGGTTSEEEEAATLGGFEEIIKDITGSFDTLNFDRLKSFFKYPEDMDDNQDRITFTQYKYVATKLSNNINSVVEEFEKRDSNLRTTKIEGTVTLPVPNQISETNQTGWGESNLTSIGAVAMTGVSGPIGSVTEGNFITGGKQLGSTIANLFEGSIQTRVQSFLTAKVAAQLISLAGINVDPEQYLTRASGAVINPNLELLFNGPKLRPFAFSFKLSPTSQNEARNIRAIIKFFKAGMAPQRSKKGDAILYLGSPNVFEIQFESRNKKLDGLPRIKMCALQSCAVNYAPDGVYAAYDDEYVQSQPVAIEIQLQFIEITPVFADEYDLENQNVPIGPDPKSTAEQ